MAEQRRKTFLREWRVKRGLSLEDAAERAGTSHPNLSKIERGIVPYNQDLLESLALAYGCDPVELLIRDPDAPTSIYTAAARATPAQRQLLERIAEEVVGFESG